MCIEEMSLATTGLPEHMAFRPPLKALKWGSVWAEGPEARDGSDPSAPEMQPHPGMRAEMSPVPCVQALSSAFQLPSQHLYLFHNLLSGKRQQVSFIFCEGRRMANPEIHGHELERHQDFPGVQPHSSAVTWEPGRRRHAL